MTINSVNANVCEKIANSKLHMAGRIQNKQKYLVFIVLWSFEVRTIHNNSKKEENST